MFWIILRKDLLISLRNSSKILAHLLFFLIFIALFFLLAQSQKNQALEPSIIIWIILVSSLIFSSSEFLKKDSEDGTLEQMLIIFQNFEFFILGKIFANWLIYCLPTILLTYFIKPELDFIILLFFATLAINSICCFCGSLSILAHSSPIIAVIALPLIIPIILISYGDFQSSLKLLIGISLFFTTILSFATAKIIKIAEE